ncbi:MAG: hypothetical protein EHM41_09595 [Chloroflexi bacterium]|nr:MAG: hypothetical protein EHM41_09595 [Chloroflexota bacterium]
MKKNNFQKISTTAAILLVVIAALGAYSTPAAAMEPNQAAGPTTANCYSGEFHAASDCDRLATGTTYLIVTVLSPTLQDCYSSVFHAASDCDRIASGNFIPVTGNTD